MKCSLLYHLVYYLNCWRYHRYFLYTLFYFSRRVSMYSTISMYITYAYTLYREYYNIFYTNLYRKIRSTHSCQEYIRFLGFFKIKMVTIIRWLMCLPVGLCVIAILFANYYTWKVKIGKIILCIDPHIYRLVTIHKYI